MSEIGVSLCVVLEPLYLVESWIIGRAHSEPLVRMSPPIDPTGCHSVQLISCELLHRSQISMSSPDQVMR